MTHSTWVGVLAAAMVGAAGLCVPAAQGGPGASAVVQQPEEIGSLRNARIARAMPADAAERAGVTLTFLAGDLTPAQVAELGAVAANVKVIHGLDRQTVLDHADRADGADGRLVSPDLLGRAKRLSWVHSPSAGVERLIAIPGIADNPSLVVTNARGVHGPAIADHAMAMLLHLTRQIGFYDDAMEAQRWERSEPPQRPIALQGRTMVVAGIGGIGTEIARRAHGFGMRVLATRRSEAPVPEFVDRVGKPGELKAMVAEADVVAICVPLTAETQRLFDASMFAAMKRGCYVINIARGKVIDTEALLESLRDGRVAGAALDVTDPEPLPADHPLWKAPNVMITPHVAADGELTEQRWWALYKENVRRFGAGEPLLNCVDVKAGY